MFCYHNPPRQLLESMATYGCEAGNVLWGMRSDGCVSGCSFLKSSGLSIFELGSVKNRRQYFQSITAWPQSAPSPCRTCRYLDICKGGCHAVAQYVTGDLKNPDPDCPFVIEYKNKGSSE
jgi:radical SAM protein with 4Fe4S-binding SPASM domain